jgi:Rad3-related DNA helicase
MGTGASASVNASVSNGGAQGADSAAGGMLDQARLARIARTHQVCPYYLSQELVRWADVVIGDYNYYFDISAMLYSLSKLNQWRISLLVDEAHNLLTRSRSMYSAELTQANIRAARRVAPQPLKKAFSRIQKHWRELGKEVTDSADAASHGITESRANHAADSARGEHSAAPSYRVLPELPQALLQALQQATSAIGDFLVLHPQALDADLQHFYFYALNFNRVAELFDPHSILDLEHRADAPKDGVLTLRNLVPAPFLLDRFAAAHACTLFSATLSPPRFYQDTLGLPEACHWVDIESPFQAQQLHLQVVRHISTRYRQRQRSLPALVDLIGQQYQSRPGNYLAFFSSFEYLEQVVQRFAALFPQIPYWQQTRRMEESERKDFLARFVADGAGIGFAVLGGNFAEGIDLPGTRLVGAFIATLGLPQFNPVNQQLQACMQARFGQEQGYAYTYLYPGLQKVVQAAGRVIRTTSDSGSVFLIDERFAQAEVQALFPLWWQIDYMPPSG